jgi:hypothetical protein
VVVFGGEGGKDGTVIYDPWRNEWRWPKPKTEPAPRSGGNLAFDAARKLHVLFGTQFTDDTHTWTYNVSTNEWQDMKPPSMPPTNKNDAVLTYDSLNKVVLAIVKVSAGEGEDTKHEVQTWAYDAGKNAWTRMNPRAEPDAAGNRTRNLIFAPELNLAILENCTGQPREQQIWTYRFAPSRTPYEPATPKPPQSPSLIEDVVVSVIDKNRVDVSWKPPADIKLAGYHLERAVVEVWTEEQLTQLKRNTPPLSQPSAGAIRRICQFKRLTEEPILALTFTDSTIDLSNPEAVLGEPIYQQDLHASHLDQLDRGYRYAVFAYRVRAVNQSGQIGGPSPACFTSPSSPQFVFSREENETCHLKWAANPEKSIAGYRVYRLDGRWNQDPVSRLTPKPISATTFTDEMAGRQTRRYYIVAVDALGQEGFPSSPVWVQREWQRFYEPFVGDWHH